MTRAAIYVRVSTTRQAERDLSIPDQVQQCRSWCDRHGIEVVQIFSEPGASALDEDRPVFQEMIHTARRIDHPFDVVVVHSLSRFSRDSLHSELYIRELRKAGVELVSITQEVAHDPTGEMFRKLLHIFDEHQSRENAKHVHRAMLENARQGFWNGARPPYGYAIAIAERRGNRDKKQLVIDEAEARIVRQIYNMASGADGRPMGIKAIASWLNARGMMRRGHRFSTGSVHVILTSSTYHGQHHFNQRDSRTGKPRPPSQWVSLAVPAIIHEATFNQVQGLLHSRSPKVVAPRTVTSPTLLAGIAHCGHCGGGLILNTGKGGQYRYYCCVKRLKQGPKACQGLRIRMDRLDDLVIGEVIKVILQPDRLKILLEEYLRTSLERESRLRDQLRQMRQQHKEAEVGVTRLLELVEKGLLQPDDPAMRDRLIPLRLRRDELANDIKELQRRASNAEPAVTPDKVERLSQLLDEKLRHGSADLRQAYARLLISDVTVAENHFRIRGSKAVLARSASTGLADTPTAVLSFVREWRAQQDSNLRPRA